MNSKVQQIPLKPTRSSESNQNPHSQGDPWIGSMLAVGGWFEIPDFIIANS